MSISTFDTVADIVCDVSDVERNTVQPNSFLGEDGLGIDSLDRLEIAFSLRKRFGINLELNDVSKNDLATLCRMIDEKAAIKAA